MLKHSLSLAAAALTLTTFAAAQTSRPAATAARSTTAAHTATSSASSTALPKNIPPVRGIPHTAYSLKYIDIVVGKGELAAPMKLYTVNYTGYLRSNGTVFDTSIPDKDHPQRKPITFPVGVRQVIPGFETGFEGMHVGGKRRIFIPYQLAYGFSGSRIIPGKPQAIPPKSDLIFDVELLSQADFPKQEPQPARPPVMPGAPPKPGTPGTFIPQQAHPPTTTPAAPSTPAAPAAPAAPPAPTAPATPTAPASQQ